MPIKPNTERKRNNATSRLSCWMAILCVTDNTPSIFIFQNDKICIVLKQFMGDYGHFTCIRVNCGHKSIRITHIAENERCLAVRCIMGLWRVSKQMSILHTSKRITCIKWKRKSTINTMTIPNWGAVDVFEDTDFINGLRQFKDSKMRLNVFDFVPWILW